MVARKIAGSLLLATVFLSSSFRTGTLEDQRKARWDVTAEDPVVWLKFCDDEFIYFDEEELEDGSGSVLVINDFASIKTRVLREFNALSTSFLRLALHPEDAHAATVNARVFGDDTTPSFDPERGAVRTVTICTAAADPTLAGFAVPVPNSKAPVCLDAAAVAGSAYYEQFCKHAWLAGCDISLLKDNLLTGHQFQHTLTHELMHCMGVLHNHETTASIMSYVADVDATYRLTSDDKMALTFLYPADPKFGKETPSLGLACQPSSK